MAIIRNLDIDQGSTFEVAIELANNLGAAFDLTAHTVTAQMRKSYASASITASFTTIIPEPTTGVVYISLTDEQTTPIKKGRYVYDLVVEGADGKKYRAIEGIVTVNPGVTKY